MNKDQTNQESPTISAPLPGFDREIKEEQDSCDHKYREILSGEACIRCDHFVGNWE